MEMPPFCGLALGKALTEWPGQIIGISVAKPAPILALEVAQMARKAADLMGAECPGDLESQIRVEDAFIGEGYGFPTPEGEAALKLFARRWGVFLDTVYSAKAAAGLLNFIEKGRFEAGADVVFLHTGGNLHLFQ